MGRENLSVSAWRYASVRTIAAISFIEMRDRLGDSTQALSHFGFRGENCIMKTKIKTQRALLACLLTSAIAMPAWSDTLILKNGVTLSGTLNRANIKSIMFKDRICLLHRYSVYDIECVQFGDAPKASTSRPPTNDDSSY